MWKTAIVKESPTPGPPFRHFSRADTDIRMSVEGTHNICCQQSGEAKRVYLVMHHTYFFGMYFAVHGKPSVSLASLKEKNSTQTDFRVRIPGRARDLESWNKLQRGRPL